MDVTRLGKGGTGKQGKNWQGEGQGSKKWQTRRERASDKGGSGDGPKKFDGNCRHCGKYGHTQQQQPSSTCTLHSSFSDATSQLEVLDVTAGEANQESWPFFLWRVSKTVKRQQVELNHWTRRASDDYIVIGSGAAVSAAPKTNPLKRGRQFVLRSWSSRSTYQGQRTVPLQLQG